MSTQSLPHTAELASDATSPARVSPVYRVIGVVLLLLVLLPVYRWLGPETGIAGSFTVEFLNLHYELMWAGSAILLMVAWAGGRFLPVGLLDRMLVRAGQALMRAPLPAYAATLALAAAAITALFTLSVLDGKPNLIDAIAQLLHARFWSEGQFSGPLTDQRDFWAIQNSLFTERGWVSQYPPGHIAILTVFLRLGAAWAAGPVLVGVTVFFTALFAERLLVNRVAARLGAALLAMSPFFLALGGSFMNHVTTAAGVALGAYALLRAWQGNARWAYLAGFSFAYAFATRQLSAMAMGLAITFTLPFAVAGPTMRRFTGLALRMGAGALPVLCVLFAYNSHFFGGPFRSGYTMALGPQMRLGFHRDPWGNWYGPLEAIAYTSSDLITLGINLFETPLPAVAVIAAFLLWSRRIGAAERVVLAWALAPVATNLLYWHHGIFMGPRMLHEAAPAWVLCFAVAVVHLYNQFGSGRIWPGGLHAQTTFGTLLLASLVMSLLYLAPQRLASYGGSWMQITRLPAPAVSQPALVFVHDSWGGRVGMQLVVAGMRLDEAETAVRQNSTCKLQQLVDAIVAGDAMRARQMRASLDMDPRADRLPGLVEIAPSDMIRVTKGESMTAECRRQIHSDRQGILDVTPLLWQGDLPGLPARGALFVRDLGPERNAQLIAQHPARRPYVYTLPYPDGEPILLPYEEGMRSLWGSE